MLIYIYILYLSHSQFQLFVLWQSYLGSYWLIRVCRHETHIETVHHLLLYCGVIDDFATYHESHIRLCYLHEGLLAVWICFYFTCHMRSFFRESGGGGYMQIHTSWRLGSCIQNGGIRKDRCGWWPLRTTRTSPHCRIAASRSSSCV